MSRRDLPEVCGEALLIPRIEPGSLRVAPAFDGMGVLIGPGAEDGTISAVVTGQKDGPHVLLDGEYQTMSPRLAGAFRLVDNHLVARRYTGTRERTDYLVKWPIQGSYTLPFETKDGAALSDVTHIPFNQLRGLFDGDRRDYHDDLIAREQSIAVHGMHLLYKHRNGIREPRERLDRFRSAKVLVGAARAGELTVAVVGEVGANNYVLAESGRKITRASRDFRVVEGTIYGQLGSREKRVASMKSRRLQKVQL